MARHHDRVCAGKIGQGAQGALYGARAWRHADRVRLRFSCGRITDVRGDPGNAMSPYGQYTAVAMNSTEVLKFSSQTGRCPRIPAFSLVWRPRRCGCVSSGAVMAIGAEASLMFASLGIIRG